METKGHACGTKSEGDRDRVREEKGGGASEQNHIQGDRWCILADSGNPFHAPDESSVRVGMCALPACNRCGRTGVRPVGFSEVEGGGREGGREGGRKHIVTWNDAPAVPPVTHVKRWEAPRDGCFTFPPKIRFSYLLIL